MGPTMETAGDGWRRQDSEQANDGKPGAMTTRTIPSVGRTTRWWIWGTYGLPETLRQVPMPACTLRHHPV